MARTLYCSKFFETKEDARDFQKAHGYGALYSNVPRSKTKDDYATELQIARYCGRSIDPEVTPYCIAWNERVEE